MSTDEYNGWTNRETWALNLWLTDDQSLYEMTRERVAEALRAYREDDNYPQWCEVAGDRERWDAIQAGQIVRDLYAALTDPYEGLLDAEAIVTMVSDIGSEYRINWDELGAHFTADLDER